MISIVGIGNAASSIVENFKTQKNNYKVYQLGSNQKNTKYTKKLKHFKNPEDYEENIPDLSKFFGDINENIQVFVVGSSYSSNYTLGILQQLQSKKLEVFYIRPDVELLTGIPKLLENMMFGVLQEYARSGLFNSLTILSNLQIENSIPGLSIKNYYEKLNHTIFSCVHYLNFFNHTEPEIGQMARPSEINKIRSIGILDVKTLSEKWLFELDMPRETCYYICINQDRLEKESGLHKQIVDLLKEKPRNAFRKVSYGIWETHLHDFGFCVTHTNAIQQNTLDKLEQE
tara:strand:- start:2047 stop:2907 length:861 start_codon:yes stop_codon:yes gene_type:complete